MITQEVVLAIVVALTGWWFSTGLILFLVHRNASLHGRLFVVATGIMLLVLMCVPAFAVVASPVNTVIGFCLALLLWGWLEMGYLMGFVTGPNRKPCPPHASLSARLRLGVGTCLWHELWLLLLVGSLYILTYEQPNQTTLWTFTALWLLRWSAKLNLVMGVRNYNYAWLPQHLEYLDSYIPRRIFNPLFPFSVLMGAGSAAFIFSLAAASGSVAHTVSYVLVAALVTLGTLEHIFLMFPMGDARLWQWAAPAEVTESGFGDR
ncbi:MAG: hypothetical protein RLZZ602_1199 [Pseudomonadota bacterium]